MVHLVMNELSFLTSKGLFETPKGLEFLSQRAVLALMGQPELAKCAVGQTTCRPTKCSAPRAPSATCAPLSTTPFLCFGILKGWDHAFTFA